LAPVPHRGKRNEPAYTSLVAQRVADLLGEEVATIDAITTENAKNLFKI
ncbi:TatD family hydrolase, partial [Vibrio chemaguriensis]